MYQCTKRESYFISIGDVKMTEGAPSFVVARGSCYSTGFGPDVTLIEVGVYRFLAARTSFEFALGFTLCQPMLG